MNWVVMDVGNICEEGKIYCIQIYCMEILNKKFEHWDDTMFPGHRT